MRESALYAIQYRRRLRGDPHGAQAVTRSDIENLSGDGRVDLKMMVAIDVVQGQSGGVVRRELRSDFRRELLSHAGAQKNMGIAGLTIVIVREDLLGHATEGTPSMLDYKVHADGESMSNTPATYAWYVAGLVFQWLKKQGGLVEMEKKNIAKSKLLYDFLDASAFFKNPVRKSDARA